MFHVYILLNVYKIVLPSVSIPVIKYKNENTVCGYVENIGREGERAVVTTLKDIRNTSVNMFTTVFVGNSQTKNINGKMVTPRGYKNG